MSERLLRPLSLAALAGGVFWIMLAVFALTSSSAGDTRVVLETTGEHLEYAVFALALAFTVPAILALLGHLRGTAGRAGFVGGAMAISGCAAQCVVIATIVVTSEEPSWFGIAAPAAIGTWVVGSIVLGVAIRRARALPGWVALSLPVASMFAIVGSEGGTSVLFGTVLIVVAMRILRATSSAGRAPAMAV